MKKEKKTISPNSGALQKKGWDERCGVYACSDGEHLSWWLAIGKTPEWQAWAEHARKNHLYDIAEVEECGWMSEEHARDFLAFTKQQYQGSKWVNGDIMF